MVGRKHASSTSSSSNYESSQSEKKGRRQITVRTFEKWQGQYIPAHESLTWLQCDKDPSDKTLISELWCEPCRKYEARMKGQKNFSNAWIRGTSNQRTSNVIDHASSNQHKTSMAYLKADLAKANNQSFSPIAHSLMNMDATTRERMKRKFDICYVMAKEVMAFSKYPTLYNLESRHEVDLGVAYKNDVSAKSFTHYLAQSQRDHFVRSLSKSYYFSFLMDGTTDSEKVEDELVIVFHCKQDDVVKEIRACARYLIVVTPNKADTDGLVDCLKGALKRLNIDDVLDKDSVLSSKPVLIGGGTDIASVNVGQHNSMRARLQDALQWMFWAWCCAHRLELASKSGLISKLFKEIEEMLLRLYYLYEKSPKKTRELASIVEDLKETFNFP